MAVLSDVLGVARRVPGVRLTERALGALERIALSELQRRLDQLGRRDRVELEPYAGPSDAPALSLRMERLLRRSMDQTPSDSRRTLFEHLIAELVPDEARIISALADGSRYPVVDVVVGGRGGADTVVLGHMSSVGRAAGVANPAFVPAYVGHLLGLGLAELGSEDRSIDDEYQILMTDAVVRDALAEASSAGRRATRTVRRTVAISALGSELWAACQHADEGG